MCLPTPVFCTSFPITATKSSSNKEERSFSLGCSGCWSLASNLAKLSEKERMALLWLPEETDPHLINNQTLPSRSPERLPHSPWSQESGGSWQMALLDLSVLSESKNLTLSPQKKKKN